MNQKYLTARQRDIRNEWTAALRSGEYLQGYKFLRYKNAFCAIGVFYTIFPCPSVKLANIVTEMAGLTPDLSMWSIMHMNDTLRLSFNEIADRIDADTAQCLITI